MKSIWYLTLTLINVFAINAITAQDCPPVNAMRDGSCFTVEYATVEEAANAVAAPAETVIVSDSPHSDGLYIAQMRSGETTVIFSQAGTCGYGGYDGAVQGTFTFTHLGQSCSYGELGFVLPVEFSYFEADKKNNFVALTWGTATEIENDGFGIERSADGKIYEEIGFVVGEGNSNTEINYAFTDRAPLSGVNYYRLKQIDYNGAYSYSSIKVVELRKDTKLDINYDLGSENLIFRTENELSNVSIFDMSGNKLIESKDQYQIGENRLNVQNLVAGNYVLIATDKKGNVSSNRFIKI